MYEQEPYPVNLAVQYPEKSSRWMAFFYLFFFLKMVLAIPHMVVLWVLGIAMFLAGTVAQLYVLFTGRYPNALFDFVVGVSRWQIRVNAFLFGLTDQYPPFRLRE